MTLVIDSLLAISATSLALLGLLVTYGLLKVVNLSHGEMIAIGSYAAFLAAAHGGNLLSECLCGLVLGAIAGAVLEFFVVRFFYGRNLGLSLLGTWGISLGLVQLLRLVFGPAGRFVPLPLEGSVSLGTSSYPLYRMFVLSICLLLLAVVAVASRSRPGLYVRAAIESPSRAESYGINTTSIFRWTFIFGSALAGLSGALIAPIVAVHPNMGSEYTTIGFLAVLLTRSQRIGPAMLACALLGAGRSLFAAATDATTATLLMYGSALTVLLGVSQIAEVLRARSSTRTWKE